MNTLKQHPEKNPPFITLVRLQRALGEVAADRQTVTDASIPVFVPVCAVLIMTHNRDDTRISYRAPRTCTCPQVKHPTKINTKSEKAKKKTTIE